MQPLNRYRLALFLLPLCLQGCPFGQLGPDANGLMAEEPLLSTDQRRVTLRWAPQVRQAISRLPGGSGSDVRTLIGSKLDKEGHIEELRYDIEIYRQIAATEEIDRAKNDYGRLWSAFWLRDSYDEGESDIKREETYRLVHFQQDIRETEYAVPFDIEPGVAYAWRVRPVYRYKGQTVAEDWMREDTIVLFGFISYGDSVRQFRTTAPPEFTLPAQPPAK